MLNTQTIKIPRFDLFISRRNQFVWKICYLFIYMYPHIYLFPIISALQKFEPVKPDVNRQQQQSHEPVSSSATRPSAINYCVLVMSFLLLLPAFTNKTSSMTDKLLSYFSDSIFGVRRIWPAMAVLYCFPLYFKRYADVTNQTTHFEIKQCISAASAVYLAP